MATLITLTNLTDDGRIRSCRFGDVETLVLIHLNLSYYSGVPSFILGIPGNILILLLASRPQNRNISASVYMRAMAVVDSIVVVVATLHIPFFYSHIVEESRELQYM
jgi:hypothetical protein